MAKKAVKKSTTKKTPTKKKVSKRFSKDVQKYIRDFSDLYTKTFKLLEKYLGKPSTKQFLELGYNNNYYAEFYYEFPKKANQPSEDFKKNFIYDKKDERWNNSQPGEFSIIVDFEESDKIHVWMYIRFRGVSFINEEAKGMYKQLSNKEFRLIMQNWINGRSKVPDFKTLEDKEIKKDKEKIDSYLASLSLKPDKVSYDKADLQLVFSFTIMEEDVFDYFSYLSITIYANPQLREYTPSGSTTVGTFIFYRSDVYNEDNKFTIRLQLDKYGWKQILASDVAEAFLNLSFNSPDDVGYVTKSGDFKFKVPDNDIRKERILKQEEQRKQQQNQNQQQRQDRKYDYDEFFRRFFGGGGGRSSHRTSEPAFDAYKELDIDKNASPDDVKKAYRKLAMQWHPDRNPDKRQEAEEKMKRINQAYDYLKSIGKAKASITAELHDLGLRDLWNTQGEDMDLKKLKIGQTMEVKAYSSITDGSTKPYQATVLKAHNGLKVGDTVKIRKPKSTVRQVITKKGPITYDLTESKEANLFRSRYKRKK